MSRSELRPDCHFICIVWGTHRLGDIICQRFPCGKGQIFLIFKTPSSIYGGNDVGRDRYIRMNIWMNIQFQIVEWCSNSLALVVNSILSLITQKFAIFELKLLFDHLKKAFYFPTIKIILDYLNAAFNIWKEHVDWRKWCLPLVDFLVDIFNLYRSTIPFSNICNVHLNNPCNIGAQDEYFRSELLPDRERVGWNFWNFETKWCYSNDI